MLRIGDFSRLARVTVKTLRFYDTIGLLRPAQVDGQTGYRYYGVEQLPRLNRILALKDLGFTLEQVTELMDNEVSADQIRGMLLLKQAEIEQRMQEELDRLSRVHARLREIEQPDQAPNYDVLLKPVEKQLAASVRAVIPGYAAVGTLHSEIMAYLGPQHVAPVGPALSIYHDLEYREQDAEVEAAIPIATDGLTGAGRVVIYELPAALMATTIHTGGFETIPAAYGALGRWISLNGYVISGPNREIYLRGPEPAGKHLPEQFITEIQFPVSRPA